MKVKRVCRVLNGLKAFCVLLLLLPILTLTVYAKDAEESLQAEVDPEAGLSAEVLGLVGPFDGAVDGLGQKLLDVLNTAVGEVLAPGLKSALRTLAVILAAVMLCSILEESPHASAAVPMAGALMILGACVGPFGSVVSDGTQMLQDMHRYMTMLGPGMSVLMTVSGSAASAAASGFGIVLFDLLLSAVTGLLVPLLYVFLALCAAESGFGMERLSRLRDLVKWILISSVKLLMWAYGAILTLTGMVSSAVDAQKMRTLRAAIAGMVPVVGNLVSEASSSLLSTASLLRTSVGVYGMLAVFGIFLTPFLRIGVQYLALKLAAALSGFFGKGSQAPLLEKLAQAVGLLLALTALASLLSLMILVHCIRTVSQ